MPIKAVLFYVDGTLVDSVDLHAEAWVDAFREFGQDIPFATMRAQIGKGGDQLMPVFLTPEALAANQPVVDLVARIAKQENATPSQVALAWLMARKPWIVPIPGTRSQQHLRENLGALDVALSAADLREIDVAFGSITVHGGRMNAEQMRAVDRAA